MLLLFPNSASINRDDYLPAQTPLISILSAISTPLPFIAALLCLNLKNLSKDIKTLLGYLGIATLAELILAILLFYGIHNNLVVHIYTPLEYIFVASLLMFWQQKAESAALVRLSIPLYLLAYAVIKIFGWEDFSAHTVNYLTRPIALILLNGFALYTLLTLWQHTSQPLYRSGRFWVLAAFTIYYSASIIVVAFMYISENQALRYLLLLHSSANILHNLLLTTGIVCYRWFDAESVTPI